MTKMERVSDDVACGEVGCLRAMGPDAKAGGGRPNSLRGILDECPQSFEQVPLLLQPVLPVGEAMGGRLLLFLPFLTSLAGGGRLVLLVALPSIFSLCNSSPSGRGVQLFLFMRLPFYCKTYFPHVPFVVVVLHPRAFARTLFPHPAGLPPCASPKCTGTQALG